MRFKDSVLGIIIVLIVLSYILPIPAELLDVLIALNITLSVLILLGAIYSEEALDMSMFPTLLLGTTLFRLGINISSTKLMLNSGYAGEVIQAFGEFVAGGNMIVGVIIFIILVMVNFMVITKGSERVAEVTARFTLDAMPGKQMAIDADLNSGLITEEDAKKRRKHIQDESNFFGAMDGATKFVKGDAIASIIITVINISGGIILGTTGAATGAPLPIGEAAELYTLMTIGDGLVGSIPSLLISVATGFIVTKANADSDVSTTLVIQLFSNPLVLFIGSGMTMLLAVTPLPFIPFFLISIALAGLGYMRLNQGEKEEIIQEISSEEVEAEEVRKPENVVSLLNVEPIILYFGYGLLPLADASQGGDLLDRLVLIRRQLALELGVIIPIIRIRDNIRFNPNEYKIQIKGVPVGEGEIHFDHYMAMNPGHIEEEIDGIPTFEPNMGLPALWINESQRERAEALGYTVVDAPAIIATHLTEVIRSNLHELLTRQDVQTLINSVKENNNILVDELIPRLLTIGEVQKVLSNLLRENISVRDLVTILETLADYATVTKDTDMLTEYVRQALKRHISNEFFVRGSSNTVVTLDPELEQEIMSNMQHSEHGSYLALDPTTSSKIFERVGKEVEKLENMGFEPIILTSPIVRVYFKRMLEQAYPRLVVLSYSEIDPKVEIQSIGMVSLN
ncbi:MAG: flagellar biosynthesis protein FlhA [Lachnospirales bacterium]